MIDLQNWLHINKLYLNTNKTNAMFFPIMFKQDQYLDKPNIKFHNEDITYVEEIKYLGVYIDYKL